MNVRFSCVIPVLLATAAAAQLTLLDPTFSEDGIVLMSLGGYPDFAEDVVIQPDGRIVVVGTKGGEDATMAVLRLQPNGVLDETFSGDGVAVAPLGDNDEGSCVALQADGRIVIAGNAEAAVSFGDLAFARFLADGTLDNTFSGDGRLRLAANGANDMIQAVRVDASGRIVGAGQVDGNGSGADMVAVRLLNDGTLDPGFGSNGMFVTTDHTGEVAEDLLLRPDGGLILPGGVALATLNGDLGIQQLTAAGEPDASFGTTGLFRPSEPGSRSVAVSAALMDDGRTLFAAKRYQPGGVPEEAYMGRITASGAWDNTYGAGGRFFVQFGQPYTGIVRDMTLLPDGKSLMVADVLDTASSTQAIMVFRLLPDGDLDPSFGIGGRAVVDCPEGACGVRGIALQPDGHVVAAGTYEVLGGTEIMIMRWLPNLSPVGVAEVSAPVMSCWPNPADEAINVHVDHVLAAGTRYELHDAQGRLVDSGGLRADGRAIIPLGHVATGVHTLTIRSGDHRTHRAVIIQH